jgi:branched-chain amino acid transport system substrate-binding protein
MSETVSWAPCSSPSKSEGAAWAEHQGFNQGGFFLRVREVSRPLGALMALLAFVILALGLAACGDDDEGGDEASAVEAVDANCSDVEYQGEGDPSALIVSDLPLQGDSAERSAQMNDAIRLELDGNGWKAGSTNVAFQACDDSIEETGEWDGRVCRNNATAYAENSDVIGVIGTYNSGCAAEIIPILNEAPGGGVAMVSPGNTLVCLTATASTCKPDEPDAYYPSGTRNYARVVPNDASQGAGLASFAENEGVHSAFILIAPNDPTSEGQGRTFEGAARALGIEIAGVEHYDLEASSYTDLMQKVKASGADAVFLGAILEENGAQLIKDKVAVLGPNDGQVKLLAPDGFAQQSTIDRAGPDSAGMFVGLPGKTPETLTGTGAELVDQLEAEVGNQPVEVFAPYAGQAAAVLLDAIGAGQDRAGTIEALFQTDVTDGIIGSFAITRTGDPTPAPISVLKAADTFELDNAIVPPNRLIAAARGG